MKLRIAAFLVIAASAHAAEPQSQTLSQSQTSSAFPGLPSSAATRASQGASVFYILMIGNSENGSAALARTFKDASPAEIQQLQAQGRYARESNLAYQHSEMNKLCATRDALSTLDTVAEALTRFDEKNAANIEQLGVEATKALGDRLGGLLVAATKTSNIMVQETDHKEVMRLLKKDPVSHIQSVCSKSSPPPVP